MAIFIGTCRSKNHLCPVTVCLAYMAMRVQLQAHFSAPQTAYYLHNPSLFLMYIHKLLTEANCFWDTQATHRGSLFLRYASYSKRRGWLLPCIRVTLSELVLQHHRWDQASRTQWLRPWVAGPAPNSYTLHSHPEATTSTTNIHHSLLLTLTTLYAQYEYWYFYV